MNFANNFWIILSLFVFLVSCEMQIPNSKKKTKNLHSVSIEGTILPDEVYVDGKLTKIDEIKLKPGNYELVLKKKWLRNNKRKGSYR